MITKGKKYPNISKALKAKEGLTPDGKSKFHVRVGKMGGTISRGGGFTKETAQKWGRVGGKISRRTKVIK